MNVFLARPVNRDMVLRRLISVCMCVSIHTYKYTHARTHIRISIPIGSLI